MDEINSNNDVAVAETVELVIPEAAAVDNLISWQERVGLNETTLCAAIETIVFMSEKPIPLMKIKKGIDPDIPMTVLHDAIKRLQDEYEQSHHGLRLQEVAEGYQFRTKATYSKFVQDTLKINTVALTKATLDVLAIIAYRQPMAKTEIEKIRGVDSNHLIRTLLDKKLIKIEGRGDDLGRSIHYTTTQEFLEVFNLKDLNDLPPEYELSELAAKNEIGTIDNIRDFFKKDWKDKFFHDDLNEIDQISSMIESVSTDTDFTRMLKKEDKRKTEVIVDPLAEAVPAGPKKSAFELLEEYLERARLAGINEESAKSELVTSIADFKVVTMADLDLPFLNAPMDEIEEEESESFDLFKEGEALEQALDEAFKTLTISKTAETEESHEDSYEVDEKVLTEAENRLEEKAQEIHAKAKDFEIDLDFLQLVQKDVMAEIEQSEKARIDEGEENNE